jgi:hypothetical protein
MAAAHALMRMVVVFLANPVKRGAGISSISSRLCLDGFLF